MRVLVACEFSGVVKKAFRKRGHDAISCDLIPDDSNGGLPSATHIQGDVRLYLKDGWDLIIAHPPCTYLCSSGIHWNARDKSRAAKSDEAFAFFMELYNAPARMVAVENPIGIVSSRFRKPDQIIQPYEFGHDASKSTCLWLRGLPLLKPTKLVAPRYFCKDCGAEIEEAAGKYGYCGNGWRRIWGNQTPSGQNKLPPSPDRWKLRSITYDGIADAMAEQWG
jgi:hypothetical protein